MSDAVLLRTLLEALRAAGELMRRNFGKARIRYKGRANIVTQVDEACEARILRSILRRFPDHDYRTEERPPRRSGSRYVWVIDPLDGTTNYAHGYPASCVSIGLLRDGRPILGGVYDPFRKEMFTARLGRGAHMNGRPIRVSGIRRLDESLLLTGFAYDRLERSRFYIEFYRDFMERSHDVRRGGAAALDMAWVAAGRAEGFWEFNLQAWDVAAGILLIEEAGGKITNFSGRALIDPERFGAETLATNGRVHRAMLKVFSEPWHWKIPGARVREKGSFNAVIPRGD